VSFYPAPPALAGQAGKGRPGPRLGPGPGASAGPAAQLSVTVVGPETINPTESLPFEIVVRNAGEGLLTGVRVEQPLPAGSRLLTSDPPAAQQEDRLSWDLGDLPLRAERRLRVEIQPGTGAEVQLCPTATFAGAAGLRSRQLQPPFAVLQHGPQTAVAGTAVVFQIQVANHLPAVLEHVALRARLSAGLQHPQGDLIEADLGALAAGETRSLELEVLAVQAGTQVSDITAEAGAGKEARVAHSRLSVQVTEPSLALQLDAPRSRDANSDLELRFQVHNLGRAPARDARLVFFYPEGFDVLDSSSTARLDPASRSVSWGLDALESGQTRVVTLKVRPRLPGDWALRASATGQGLADAAALRTVHVNPGGPPPVANAPASPGVARTEAGWR
jgi:hypothetical protein